MVSPRTTNTKRKSVIIEIKGTAEYDGKTSSPIDFGDFVDALFKAHKAQLENEFKKAGDLNIKSVLRDFQFDSVEKQIR